MVPLPSVQRDLQASMLCCLPHRAQDHKLPLAGSRVSSLPPSCSLGGWGLGIGPWQVEIDHSHCLLF